MGIARNQRRLNKKETLKSWKGRQCGDCTACCTVLGVEELHKQSYKPCAHECSTGCAIYQDRPFTCRTYMCCWRLGALPEEFYPPKMGVVIDETNELGAVSFREVVPGALNRLEVRRLIGLFATRQVVVLIKDENTREITGPKTKLEQFHKLATKKGWIRG